MGNQRGEGGEGLLQRPSCPLQAPGQPLEVKKLTGVPDGVPGELRVSRASHLFLTLNAKRHKVVGTLVFNVLGFLTTWPPIILSQPSLSNCRRGLGKPPPSPS